MHWQLSKFSSGSVAENSGLQVFRVSVGLGQQSRLNCCYAHRSRLASGLRGMFGSAMSLAFSVVTLGLAAVVIFVLAQGALFFVGIRCRPCRKTIGYTHLRMAQLADREKSRRERAERNSQNGHQHIRYRQSLSFEFSCPHCGKRGLTDPQARRVHWAPGRSRLRSPFSLL